MTRKSIARRKAFLAWVSTCFMALFLGSTACVPAAIAAQPYESTYATLFPSLLRVGSGTAYEGAAVFSGNARGLKAWVNVTAEAGTATLVVKLQGKDGLTSTWFDITSATTGTISATSGDQELTVYPGIAETANVSISDVLPRYVRAVATVGTGGSSSFTFSVGASLIP